jgi:tRNA pseudouridine55 synthase
LGRRRNKGRSVNGIFLLNKPSGLSSNQALQRVKKLFDANKAGHTGSLDPLATGLLPICLGEATKFSQFLLDSNKHYLSTFILGIRTETGDADGEVVDRSDASNLTKEQIISAVANFKGSTKQVPSMYSALKHNGQPLYKLARQGMVVQRDARDITVLKYDILDFRAGKEAELDVEVHVSKGTYVRSLAEDLGSLLGCGAHVSALHRHIAGPFNDGQSTTLDALYEKSADVDSSGIDYLLEPMDVAVANYSSVELSVVVAGYFQQGQQVLSNQAFRNGEEGDIVRVFRETGEFLGVGVVTAEGQVAPKRLVVGA